MKKQRFVSGAIVKITIGDGYHTYGRLMVNPYIEIFDFKTKDETKDFQRIVESPILFTVCMFYRQAISNGLWKIVGKIPFDEHKISTPPQYRQSSFDNSKCVLVDMFGNEVPAMIDECQNMERLVVWTPKRIVARIEDYYAGKPYVSSSHFRLREIGDDDL